jgi:hypothetical protein
MKAKGLREPCFGLRQAYENRLLAEANLAGYPEGYRAPQHAAWGFLHPGSAIFSKSDVRRGLGRAQKEKLRAFARVCERMNGAFPCLQCGIFGGAEARKIACPQSTGVPWWLFRRI